MGKGKRGRLKQQRKYSRGTEKPKGGSRDDGNSFAYMLSTYGWKAPCEHCKRLGIHDPDCPAYVRKSDRPRHEFRPESKSEGSS
jgi:hypothetical protein